MRWYTLDSLCIVERRGDISDDPSVVGRLAELREKRWPSAEDQVEQLYLSLSNLLIAAQVSFLQNSIYPAAALRSTRH